VLLGAHQRLLAEVVVVRILLRPDVAAGVGIHRLRAEEVAAVD